MNLLTQDALDQINSASLDLLESVGVRVDHPVVLDKLLRAGAKQGGTASPPARPGARGSQPVARIPRELVKECLARAPRNLRLADRRGGCVEVGADGGTVFWGGNSLCIARGRERKEMDSHDLADFTRLLDTMDHVHGVVGTSISDYPPQVRDFVGFRILAENSTKHLRPVIFSPDGPLAIIEMAEVLANRTPLSERPIVSFGYSIVSPLHWTSTALELFVRTSGRGLPMMVNAEPMAGGTAPVTLAGLLAQANAEALSGIVILQLLEPGRPCVFNLGFAHMLDMRSALATSGRIQDGLIAAAGAEIARYHGLPSASWISSDNSICDEQSTLEKATTCLLHVLGGVNIIWGIGQLETEFTLSPEQAILDNEIAGICLRAQRGIEVNPDTIALDVIKECALTGDYLSHDHTLSHFRDEMIESDGSTSLTTGLTAPKRREEWLASGGLTLGDRLRKRVEEILASPREPCVTPEQSEELRKIERKWLDRLT